ncbi:MAG: response regulator transcription factor CtrA [Holosporaceae bacterium]
MRVLIVEDDSAVAQTVKAMLTAENYVVDSTNMGEDGLDIAKLYDYDIILLDLMLPDVDGYKLLERLRSARVKTPVLILSGLKESDEIIRGLNVGADDYLTKPFNKEELLARIGAVVRRSKGHATPIIRLGRLNVNLHASQADVDGVPLNLTCKEYSILELLVLRKGATLSKEVFLNHLYGGMDEPELKIIDVFVCKLRKKLADALGSETNYIETVWGRGYVLRDPETKAGNVAQAADLSRGKMVAGG